MAALEKKFLKDQIEASKKRIEENTKKIVDLKEKTTTQQNQCKVFTGADKGSCKEQIAKYKEDVDLVLSGKEARSQNPTILFLQTENQKQIQEIGRYFSGLQSSDPIEAVKFC